MIEDLHSYIKPPPPSAPPPPVKMKLKFQNKLELRCRNHAIHKPKNLIWPPGSHLENEVTENQ